MASIQKVKDSSKFTIRFRFQGRNIHRSLGTGDRKKALKGDKRLVVNAASAGQKAADWIMGATWPDSLPT